MNICHLASGDLWAGAEVQLATLLEGLRTYDDLTLSVVLFNEGILADKVRGMGIENLVLDESTMSASKLTSRTKQFLADQEIDLLHTHRYKENILGQTAAKRAGTKYRVRHIHGMPEPQVGIKAIKGKFYQRLDYLASKSADRLITVSDDIREHLRGSYPDTKLVTVHNGIELDQPIDPTAIWRVASTLKRQEGELLIGTMGRLMPVKSYDLLIRAFAEVAKVLPTARLIIAGDGPERNSLEEIVKEVGMAECVLFYGFTTDVASLLSSLDLFVLSSRHEGISIALLEAQALGCPAVATNVGGNREVIVAEETGLLVEPNDCAGLAAAMVRLLSDPKLASCLTTNAHQRIKAEFSQNRMAAGVYQVYREVCNV